MSPELFSKNIVYSKYSDCYSFGLIIYEIFEKNIPFHNNEDIKCLKLNPNYKDYKTDFKSFIDFIKLGIKPSFSENVISKYDSLKFSKINLIMLKCLNLSPELRYSDFDSIILDLNKI
jgi:serine/threonine protein kinase